ncbi:MAG: SLC45 family MFS transporter [Ruminococcaceae bacterium]|nr:SLC45 family MFS transporter [Oscillospiraceae bacterium]
MKLNYKRTFFVGTAFFLITLFWQTYDSIIPKILTDKFGMSQFWSGVIMAFDNVIALFLLPLFGTVSDKAKFKKGRRTPFILVGTIIAATALVGLSVVDYTQLKNLEPISAVVDVDAEGYDSAMKELYKSDVEFNVDGEKITLSDKFTEDEFVNFADKYRGVDGSVDTKNAEYSDFVTDYLTPARQAYAARTVSVAPSALIIFVAVLLIALLSMATFRSPAVALMPDVTPKPLRSKANAIINLMGTAGGILILVSGIVFGTGKAQNTLMNYIPVFAVTAGLMILALIFFMIKVKEPQFVEDMKRQSKEYGIVEEENDNSAGTRKLSKSERLSLFLILASVVFWFMGYNAVTSKYSVYASNILRVDFNYTLIIAQIAAIIAFIPVGMIATKIGRKKTIIAGVIMLGASFVIASFVDAGWNIIVINLLFTLAGIGWATINVNSYPMVVEMAKGSNVGKYTGYYYTASMAAQTLTPMLSGFIFDKFSMRLMFPYAAVFVGLAFITMLFVRHGDSKPIEAKDKLESFDVD